MMPSSLVVPPINWIPTVHGYKNCHSWDELTVLTAEVPDEDNKVRGAVTMAMSKNGRPDGVATFSTIEEAETIIQLIQNAIDDAKRIERGEATLAQEGIPTQQ
jgi:hypothetical protein